MSLDPTTRWIILLISIENGLFSWLIVSTRTQLIFPRSRARVTEMVSRELDRDLVPRWISEVGGGKKRRSRRDRCSIKGWWERGKEKGEDQSGQSMPRSLSFSPCRHDLDFRSLLFRRFFRFLALRWTATSGEKAGPVVFLFFFFFFSALVPRTLVALNPLTFSTGYLLSSLLRKFLLFP